MKIVTTLSGMGEEMKGRKNIKIKTTKPKPGENVTMALTQPYCIATVTKTDKITFE